MCSSPTKRREKTPQKLWTVVDIHPSSGFLESKCLSLVNIDQKSHGERKFTKRGTWREKKPVKVSLFSHYSGKKKVQQPDYRLSEVSLTIRCSTGTGFRGMWPVWWGAPLGWVHPACHRGKSPVLHGNDLAGSAKQPSMNEPRRERAVEPTCKFVSHPVDNLDGFLVECLRLDQAISN